MIERRNQCSLFYSEFSAAKFQLQLHKTDSCCFCGIVFGRSLGRWSCSLTLSILCRLSVTWEVIFRLFLSLFKARTSAKFKHVSPSHLFTFHNCFYFIIDFYTKSFISPGNSVHPGSWDSTESRFVSTWCICLPLKTCRMYVCTPYSIYVLCFPKYESLQDTICVQFYRMRQADYRGGFRIDHWNLLSHPCILCPMDINSNVHLPLHTAFYGCCGVWLWYGPYIWSSQWYLHNGRSCRLVSSGSDASQLLQHSFHFWTCVDAYNTRKDFLQTLEFISCSFLNQYEKEWSHLHSIWWQTDGLNVLIHVLNGFW